MPAGEAHGEITGIEGSVFISWKIHFLHWLLSVCSVPQTFKLVLPEEKFQLVSYTLIQILLGMGERKSRAPKYKQYQGFSEDKTGITLKGDVLVSQN